MNVVAVSMFRNEADIAEAVLRHLVAEGVARILVYDNLSTDGTSEILRDMERCLPLVAIPDPEPGYYQSEKMTRLARLASSIRGAEWVLPFDADEVWYSPDGRTIAEALTDCDHDVAVCHGYDHIAQHDTPSQPFEKIEHRRPEYQRIPKVVFRAHPDVLVAQGNHAVGHPGRSGAGPLEYRHFQYRTFEQYKSKVRNGRRAYELTDLPQTEGAHWREAGKLAADDLVVRWRQLCDTPGLVYDPAPVRR